MKLVPRQERPSSAGPSFERVAQKRRTRNDLIRAAAVLRDRGDVPTVAHAADEAGVSRATAYRYFPSQELLLAEASAAPLSAAIAAAVERAASMTDVEERVAAIFALAAPIMLAHEAELRTMLKISLERTLGHEDERDVPLRSERWIAVWDPLLEPLRERVTPRRYALMVRSIGTLLGIESIAVLKDACDGDPERTIAALTDAARAMTHGFLAEAQPVDEPFG